MRHLIQPAAAPRTPRAARRHSTSDRLSTAEVMAVVVMALALIGAALSPALGRTAARVVAGPSVTVPERGTLWEIASAHPVPGLTTAETVELIKELNGIADGTVLRPGQVVLVPAGVEGPAVAQR